MDTNILITASALSDQELLARLEGLAGNEREASAELVAHLAALDSRPSLFAAQGYGSLFSYCTQALRLSEDAAGPSPPRDPRRRSGRDLRPRAHGAPREGRKGQAGGGRQAAANPAYPSRHGYNPAYPSREKRREGRNSALPSRHLPPDLPSPTVPPGLPSRHVPREVKREVWRRDAGECAFVSATGRRCTENTFLEYHHIQPYAMQGPATVANISLRCWRHNQYEAERLFGPQGPSVVREASQPSAWCDMARTGTIGK